MCGLCGILGAEAHWADSSGLEEPDEFAAVRRKERQARVLYLNRLLRLFGCTVSDWQGSAYLLNTFTGKTEIVDNLTALWSAVERLSGRRPDPLAANLLDHLRQAQ
jgi:hypothetical protein